MAALTETYVDPAIAANSGSGTLVSPYGDLQYALNTMTRDATNGDRINIKAGTAEVLTATISFATYGTPTTTAPLVFQGYTSAAGDGGLFDINGNAGNFNIFDGSKSNVSFIDGKVRNTGSASVIKLGATGTTLVNLEIYDTTSHGVENNTSTATILNCYVHDFDAAGIQIGNGSVHGCFIIIDHAAGGTQAINIIGASATLCASIQRNIILVTANNTGINVADGAPSIIAHNSILCNAGAAATRRGIFYNSGFCGGGVFNNIVEGFSGTGGAGIENAGSSQNFPLIGYNAVYDCETAYDFADVTTRLGDDETLSVTPFMKIGSPTFANRYKYFAPKASGHVCGGAYLGGGILDKGAVQRGGPAIFQGSGVLA